MKPIASNVERVFCSLRSSINFFFAKGKHYMKNRVFAQHGFLVTPKSAK